jgi:hypothetical protein
MDTDGMFFQIWQFKWCNFGDGKKCFKELVGKRMTKSSLCFVVFMVLLAIIISQTCPFQGLVLLQHFNNVSKVKCWYNHWYEVEIAL